MLLMCLILAFGLTTFGTTASGATSTASGPQSVEVAKKKKRCRAGYKKSGSKCKKGPYKKGQTCAMSKQKEYLKYGFICLDLSTPGFPLTYLDVYKK
jgi:hypothetical protein